MDIKLETLRYYLVIFWKDFFTIDFLLLKWAICNTKPLHVLYNKCYGHHKNPLNIFSSGTKRPMGLGLGM